MSRGAGWRLLALGLLAPGSAGAQPPGAAPRIGLLDNGSLAARAPLWEAFRQGMRELGYVEGRTVSIEARGADGKTERLPALAAELVRLKVDVIVTAAGGAAQAAHQATATIPIVMASGDRVAGGLVATLARPGGNVTGLRTLSIDLSAKRLELARDLVPGTSRFAILEPRGADGKTERLPALASELVRLKVEAIVVAGTSARQAAQQASEKIPIVMASGDPLAEGAVTSLARPGANVTGVTTLTRELSAKRFELAREVIPGVSRLAILWDAASAGGAGIAQETEVAARALGVHLHAVGARSAAELDGAFSAIARERPAVLLVAPSPMFFGERRRLAELAVKHRLPMVSGQREYVEAGGLIAYGTKLAELFRRAAVYVDKILKGAKPADLPIEQPTKFELVVNLKTAEVLGLTIPPSILLQADDVIR